MKSTTKRSEQNQSALEAYLSQLKAELLIKGVPAVDPANVSIERFRHMSPAEQQTILVNISSYLQILAQDLRPSQNRREYEIERLRAALRSFNLKLADQDFYDKIGEDDFVEFYDEGNVQIYRSVRFFNLCSYSLLDLSVNPWNELYEKPASAMDELLKLIERAKNERKSLSCDLGSFLQREKFAYASAESLRTFLVNFRWCTPLLKSESGEVAGFMCSFTANILAEGGESNRYGVVQKRR